MTHPVYDLSIVIPVLNDGSALDRLLTGLTGILNAPAADPHQRRVEIIVADGGSIDDGCAVAERHGCVLVTSAPSRGVQMQTGYKAARGQWIWFLHADSEPDATALAWLLEPRSPCWGRFDVRFSGDARGLGMVAAMMNRRSKWTGICTGDQGIFVQRSLLASVGGVPLQSLMEDIELSTRLKRRMPPLSPAIALTTSSRRWERRGVVRTIIGMWWYRLRYFMGSDPERLAGEYYR